MSAEPGAGDVEIRPLAAEDEGAWRTLWTDYLRFYETSVPEETYVVTWSRLLSGGAREFRGAIARGADGAALGLTHYLLHRHCWSVGDVCYLQDLYVAPEARGRGVGRRLMETVYAEADAQGAANVYWLTQDFNAPARRLYDRIGVLTPFIKYNRR